MKLRLLGAVLFIILFLGVPRAESASPEYIVVLKSGNSIDALNKAHGTTTKKQISGIPIYLVQGGAGDDGSLLQELSNDPGVASAEFNARVKLHNSAEASLNPSLAAALASLLDGQTLTSFYGSTVLQSYVNQPALALTHVSDVRNISTGAGTRIAYIDTGVDFYHPALQPWLDPGVNVLGGATAGELDGLSQMGASLLDQMGASLLDQAMAILLDGSSTSGTLLSDYGHGTLVAGVLHLVAPQARIVPIKAFNIYGNSTMFAITQGVYAATEMGVDVLNMSFSTTEDSPAFRKAIQDAHAAGVAIVASVGNNADGTTTYYPASYPNVIGVAATDFNDRLAGFSNYGSAVSVEAPGAYVVSTVPGGKYAAAWGTSFSAPMVAGEIALLLASPGNAHSDSNHVINTADPIDSLNPGFAGKLGKGRINALQAIKFDK